MRRKELENYISGKFSPFISRHTMRQIDFVRAPPKNFFFTIPPKILHNTIMMIVIFITFQAQIKNKLSETCFSPRLSSVTGLVVVLARRPRWLLDAI